MSTILLLLYSAQAQATHWPLAPMDLRHPDQTTVRWPSLLAPWQGASGDDDDRGLLLRPACSRAPWTLWGNPLPAGPDFASHLDCVRLHYRIGCYSCRIGKAAAPDGPELAGWLVGWCVVCFNPLARIHPLTIVRGQGSRSVVRVGRATNATGLAASMINLINR